MFITAQLSYHQCFKKLLIITSSIILRNSNGVMTFKMLHIPLKKLNRDKECFWLCKLQQMLHKGTSQSDYDINFTDKTILFNSFLLRWRVHLQKYMTKLESYYNVKVNDYLRKWLNKDIQRSATYTNKAFIWHMWIIPCFYPS